MFSPSARSVSRKSLAFLALPSCMPLRGPVCGLRFVLADSGL